MTDAHTDKVRILRQDVSWTGCVLGPVRSCGRRSDDWAVEKEPEGEGCIPASASVPRWDSHQVSTRPVLACASITKMFGQESRKRVEAMGPRRKSSRREPPTAPALCNWSAVLAATPLVRSDSPTLFEDHQRPGKGRMFKCYPSTTGSAGRVSRSEL
jgi:hypothetical protein